MHTMLCLKRGILIGRQANASVLLLVFIGILTACGGGSGSPAAPAAPASPLLTSIAVGPPDSSVAMGLTHQFTATGIYNDGSKQDISSSVMWTSANANVASISNAAGSLGVAMTVSPGSTTIMATMANVSGSTTLTVTAATLVSIGVTPTNGSVANGTTKQFTATGIYTDNSAHDLTNSVTWSSADSGVASVSNGSGTMGLATTVSPGSTKITANLNGVSASTMLTVTAATLVSISVTPTHPSVANGSRAQFTATGVYTDNSTQNLTTSVNWTSSDLTVASVSNATVTPGLTSTANPGVTTVTATLNGTSGSTVLSVTAATLVSIGVTPPNASIASGLQSQFVATGIYTDNSTQNLTAQVVWTSSDATVTTVSNAAGYQGLATVLSPGSATVTATLGSVSGSTLMTATAATLVSIGVTPAAPSIAKGTTLQFTAIGTYTDNSTQDLSSSVTWNSSNALAVISNASGSKGLATAVSPGSAIIMASAGSVSGGVSLTITPATLVSIAVTPATPSIANGTTQQFTAIGTYTDNSTQDLTSSVAWSSTNSSVAAVSNAPGSQGLTTAVGQGSATIMASSGSASSSISLTVTPAAIVSIAVTPATPSIANGTTQQFTAIGTYTDNSTQDLTFSVAWSSSDTLVAAVSSASGSQGLTTAIGPGSVTITAAMGSVSGTATLTVTPATLVSIGVTPTNPIVTTGTSQQFTASGTYTDGTTQNLTASVSWNSSDTAIALISNAPGSQGLATAGNPGSVTIVASAGNVSGSASLTSTTIININALVNVTTDLTGATFPMGNSPIQMNLPAGTYVATPTGVAGGGAYNALQLCTCNIAQGVAPWHWIYYFTTSENPTPTLVGTPSNATTTDLAALASAVTQQITLQNPGWIKFFLIDSPYTDDAFGVSLQVSTSSTIVNINSLVNVTTDPTGTTFPTGSSPIQMNLPAGTYVATPTGVAGGGAYNALQLCTCNIAQGVPPWHWIYYFTTSENPTPTLVGTPSNATTTDLAALASAVTQQITLQNPGWIKFFLIDTPYTDDAYGVSLTITAAAPIPVTVTIPATDGPWSLAANPTLVYEYASETPAEPYVVQLQTLLLSAGATMTIQCTGGTANAGGLPDTGCAGLDSGYSPSNGTFQPACGTYPPSYYVPSTEWPIYGAQMIGSFANASGTVIGQPFLVPPTRISLVVPVGATELLLGINDCLFGPGNGGGANTGSLTVAIN